MGLRVASRTPAEPDSGRSGKAAADAPRPSGVRNTQQWQSGVGRARVGSPLPPHPVKLLGWSALLPASEQVPLIMGHSLGYPP